MVKRETQNQIGSLTRALMAWSLNLNEECSLKVSGPKSLVKLYIWLSLGVCTIMLLDGKSCNTPSFASTVYIIVERLRGTPRFFHKDEFCKRLILMTRLFEIPLETTSAKLENGLCTAANTHRIHLVFGAIRWCHQDYSTKLRSKVFSHIYVYELFDCLEISTIHFKDIYIHTYSRYDAFS